MLKQLFRITLWVLLIAPALGAQTQPSTLPPNDSALRDISPSKQALIKELIESSDIKKNMELFMNSFFDEIQKTMPDEIWDSLSQSMKDLTAAEQQRLREDVTASVTKANQRFRELFMQRVDLGRVVDDISIPIYAKYFTEAELQDLIAFNKSSTGQHMKEVMPQLMIESLTRSEQLLGPMMRDISKEISSDETAKFKSEIDVMMKHHTTKPRGRSNRRP